MFGSVLLAGLDSVRLVVLVVAALVAVQAARLAATTPDRRQQARYVATALFALVVRGNKLSHMGDYASWRYVADSAAILIMAWGVVPERWRQPRVADAP